MAGFSIRWRWSFPVRFDVAPRIDGVRAVGMACALYIFLFTILLAAGHQSPWVIKPNEFYGLVAGLIVTILGLVMSWRTVCIAGWMVLGMIAGMLFEVSSFIVEEAASISLVVLGLGIPFLLLLEVILTIEGATAKARVIFRSRPLAKALLLSAAVMLGLLVSFSKIGMLTQYANSPEAATFQSAMMAGLAAMVFSYILLMRSKYGRDGG